MRMNNSDGQRTRGCMMKGSSGILIQKPGQSDLTIHVAGLGPQPLNVGHCQAPRCSAKPKLEKGSPFPARVTLVHVFLELRKVAGTCAKKRISIVFDER